MNDKIECNLFSVENGMPNTVFKFFPQKPSYRLDESRKIGFGDTFSPMSMVLLGRLFSKIIGFTHEWTRTNSVNFMKIGSKIRPVSCVLVHKITKYTSVLTLCVCDQGPPKTENNKKNFLFYPL